MPIRFTIPGDFLFPLPKLPLQGFPKPGLLKRLKDEPRRFIQVIYGPRQVGKTTLVRQIMEDLDYPHLLVAADAVPAGDGLWIAQHWESIRVRQQQQFDKPFLLVIDEVQLLIKNSNLKNPY